MGLFVTILVGNKISSAQFAKKVKVECSLVDCQTEPGFVTLNVMVQLTRPIEH